MNGSGAVAFVAGSAESTIDTTQTGYRVIARNIPRV